MAHTETPHSEARRDDRRKVSAPATLSVGADVFYGSVLDVSGAGAFFQPQDAIVRGEYTLMLSPTQHLQVNDRVRLEFSDGGRRRRGDATVRWVGCSNTHWSYGVGLELTTSARPH